MTLDVGCGGKTTANGSGHRRIDVIRRTQQAKIDSKPKLWDLPLYESKKVGRDLGGEEMISVAEMNHDDDDEEECSLFSSLGMFN